MAMRSLRRLWWMITTDRLGPDLPFTHLLLFSERLGRWLCKRRFAAFGDSAWVRPHAYCYFTKRIHIGNNVVVRPGTKLIASHLEGGEIVLEDDALIAPDVTIVTNTHAYDNVSEPIRLQGHFPPGRVIVRSGAWIGTRVIILPGVTIGRNSVVGAGSVVTKSIPDYSVAVGNPARVVKTLATAPLDRESL